jgi:hypothetical protein
MDSDSLKTLTYQLWECLSRLRHGEGTESDRECCEKSYRRLRELFDEYYNGRHLGELVEADVWFTRQVLDAYRELRKSLNL